MGVFTSLFGTSPRVAVVEAFAENPTDEFSVPQIVRITGTSKRGVYMNVRRLLEEGILVKSRKVGKCQYYRFNRADPRGEALTFLADVLALGALESRIKADQGIPLDRPFPLRRRFEPRYVLQHWMALGPQEGELLSTSGALGAPLHRPRAVYVYEDKEDISISLSAANMPLREEIRPERKKSPRLLQLTTEDGV